MQSYYQNKIVVITGAASGMGRAYALAFAAKGAHVALNDYDAEGLQVTAQMVNATSKVKIYTQAFDVSDANTMQAFADAVQRELGLVDIVINNAGVGTAAEPTWDLSLRDYDRAMRINFGGVLNGTKAFLPQLIENGRGHIVNVSSIFGLVGSPNNTAYCASKFAVRGFTESLMIELQESDIQVHLLHPGGVDTNICAGIEGAADFSQQYLTTSPDDIANYLLCEIPKGTARMVYGQDSFKTWMGATLLPLKLLNKVIWAEMKKVLDLKPYQKIKAKS